MLHKIIYSFPVQLLLHHSKHNQLLLALWGFLLLAVTQNFGNEFGVPYLFLDPAYLNEVNFLSMFFMGIATGGLTMSYHITCYVLDSYRFNFLGALKNPFSKFCLNNSTIPAIFIVVYFYEFITYQIHYEYRSYLTIFTALIGFLVGLVAIFVATFFYFKYTNKDIFHTLTEKVDKQLKRNAFNRLFALQRLQTIHTLRLPVKYYLDFPFVFRKAFYNFPYQRDAIAQVFDQNQFNAVSIQLLVGLVFILLGWFRDIAYLQLPAAAMVMIAIALVMTIIGGVAYWLRSWAVSVSVIVVAISSYYFSQETKNYYHQAFGMDYSTKATYNLRTLQHINSDENYLNDKKYMLQLLENWKKNNINSQDNINKEQEIKGEKSAKKEEKVITQEKEKLPKMIFVCTSGGGMRAAVWTIRTMQVVDSLLKGDFMKQTILITGASGGMLGAAYFRELYWQKQQGKITNLYANDYANNMAKDKLNTLIYSLIVNDLTLRTREFTIANKTYPKDRGYAFERQLNIDTDFVMDKRIGDYQKPEFEAKIPMLLLTPTIANDSRKLYISSQPVSFLTTASLHDKRNVSQKVKGIEFRRLFANQQADSLRFTTALRMNATFPYITPNVLLPSVPAMEIMDAGVIDNFGVSDAMRFLYVFREWIAENTSGVIVICVRDAQKEKEIDKHFSRTFLQDLVTPLQSIIGNLSSRQDITNDNIVEYAKGWFANEISTVDFQYQQTDESEMQRQKVAKASLNWRLTRRELAGIRQMTAAPENKKAMKKLEMLMKE
jgi:hypothetical protein